MVRPPEGVGPFRTVALVAEYGAMTTGTEGTVILSRDVDVTEFPGFAEPGWGKIAAHLRVVPCGQIRTLLSYECRAATTDLRSRRHFARY